MAKLVPVKEAFRRRVDTFTSNKNANGYLALLRFVVFITGCLTRVGSDSLRVCTGDVLDIKCPSSHVIVPSVATFGRMEINECIMVKDFIGCENDVLFLIDKWCSGRKDCHVVNPYTKLEKVNEACLKYLRMYLELQYSCLKVTELLQRECHSPIALNDQEAIISSHMTTDTGCGSTSSHWIITAKPGQIITLTIIDFGSEAFKRENDSLEIPIYGYIQDGSQQITIHASTERQRLLYQSKTSEISLELLHKDDGIGFLLRFQIIGCPDLVPPAHAWYKRDGDQAVIGCEWSQKTWHLSCDGQSWSGVVGNCSVPGTQEPFEVHKETDGRSALWLVCVISVSVVVMVTACVTGVVCIKKYRIKQDVQKSTTIQRLPGQGHYDLDPNIEMASMLHLPYSSGEQQHVIVAEPQRPTSYLVPQDEAINELTPIRIWERPLPDLPDKPLNSSTINTCPTGRPGRTPGDGDEAVGDSVKQGHETLERCITDQDTKCSSFRPMHAQ